MSLFCVSWHETRTVEHETLAHDKVSKERDGFEMCLRMKLTELTDRKCCGRK